MNTPISRDEVVARELKAILIRHLPLGLEGVGHAQAKAVLAMLQHRAAQRDRHGVLADAPTSRAQPLRALAAEHAHASVRDPDGNRRCLRCRTSDGTAEQWPCPVWSSAHSLGLVDTDTYPAA